MTEPVVRRAGKSGRKCLPGWVFHHHRRNRESRQKEIGVGNDK